MNLCEADRVVAGMDIWVVPNFAQDKLRCDPAKLQKDMEDKYPVRGNGEETQPAGGPGSLSGPAQQAGV